MRHHPLSLVSFSLLLLIMAFGSLPFSTATAQDSAIGLLKQMIAIAADNGGAGRTEELNTLKQRINALPKPARGDKQKARIANDNGLAAYKAGQNEQAKEYFMSAYQADPADAEIAGNLALVYLNLGDSKKVVETLTVALALAPGRASSWVNLATYYALQGQQREAVACYALTFHFSQNQNKTREFLQKLATNPDQSKVQQAAQEALQLSLIQVNSGTVATASAQDTLDAPLPPAAHVSSVQPNVSTAPQASTAAPVAPSTTTTQPMVPSAQPNVPTIPQASTTPPTAPNATPIQPATAPPTQSARAIPAAELQLATPSTRESGRSQQSQAVSSPQEGMIPSINQIRAKMVDFCPDKVISLFEEKIKSEEEIKSFRGSASGRTSSRGDIDLSYVIYLTQHQLNLSQQIQINGDPDAYDLKKSGLGHQCQAFLKEEEEAIKIAYKSEQEAKRKVEEEAAEAKRKADIEAAEAKKKADAEKLAERVKMEKDKLQKEAGANIQKASQIGPKIAKDIGVEWQFSEAKDPMTDARIMKSEASFEGEGQLIVDIEATCLVESKKLTITATAFDSHDSGKSVPFIQKDKEVNLIVRLNENKPKNITSKIDKYNNQLDQLGEDLVTSDCYDKMTAITGGNPLVASMVAMNLAAVSVTSTMVGKKEPSEAEATDLLVNALVPVDPSLVCIKQQPNNKWFEFSELRVQFPLAHGNVIARIAPYEPNLRRVLEACADVTPQTQLPEPSTSEVKESSSKKEESSPNSSLFDSIKIQGKPLTP